MSDERCPHCGSEDYGTVNEGHEWCCATCGYDTEHGTLGVCIGGKHPLDNRGRRSAARGVCCGDCYKRIPRDLPERPRWRSRWRTLNAITWKYPTHYAELNAIQDAMRAWLADHPRETSNP